MPDDDPIDWAFHEDAGVITADLGPDWPGFTFALNDSVTSRGPRGAADEGELSTYWIERVLSRLATAQPGDELTSGNATRLIRSQNGVVARSDYETHPEEEMPLAEFTEGIQSWRAEVLKRL